MTMARPKRRALSGATAASAGPSRRCRCQSSGRRRVSRSIAARFYWLLGALQRLAVEGVPWRPGDARGEPRGIARRQGLEQQLEDGLRIDIAVLPFFRAGGADQHEFALLAARIGREPGPRGAERQAREPPDFLLHPPRHLPPPAGTTPPRP